jgi:hypothetical protein
MKNIVGEPFDDYVTKQVYDRQKIHGQGFSTIRDNNTLLYLNSKTGWIKLSSGVVIVDGERLDRIGLNNHPSFVGPDGNNTGLSNFFVLANGVTDNAGTIYAGIDVINGQPNQDIGQSILNKVAYGIGGTEFGLRPMPGILSCESKFRNRGSIREGSVQIKAFNRAQLEIISLLYLRLGFPMLLEWGHSIIVGSEGEINTNPDYSISRNFLKPEYKTDNEVLRALEKQRETSAGNYDGMYGRVVNFDWTFNKDGSYDITLKLISIGAVVESFKINSYLKDFANEQKESNSDEAAPEDDGEWITKYRYSHTIGNIFYKAYTKLNVGAKELNSINKKDVEPELTTFDKVIDYIPFVRLFFQPSVSPNEDKDYIRVGTKHTYLFYVRFGEFLRILQTLVPYNTTDPSNPTPLLIIKQYDSDQKEIFIPMYTENYQIAGDPRICFIGGYDIKNIKEISEDKHIISELDSNPFRLISNGVLVGNLNNVYVNMGFILSKLADLKDTNSKVSLIDLIHAVTEGINKSLGNINKIDAIVDENTNMVRFIDETPIANLKTLYPDSEKESPVFNVYGYYENQTSAGFIKDFSLKTEITNDTMAMMTIGATANNNIVGEDATAFSKWNQGLKPIINESIDYISSKQEVKPTPQQQIQNLTTDNEKLIKQYWDYISDQYTNWEIDTAISDTTSEMITNYLIFENELTNLYFKEKQKNIDALKSRNKVSATSSRGFLPINFSMTMDGLSGIKIYQKMKADITYLPQEYPDALEFVIKGVSNVIDNNGWVTTIETVSTPVIDFVDGGENTSTNNTSTSRLSPTNRADTRNYVSQTNANKLRNTLTQLGYIEKGKEIDNGGIDISSNIEKAVSSVLKTIKQELPNIRVEVTGGNDIYHQNLSYISRHTEGNAVDLKVSPSDPATLNKVVTILQRYTAGNAPNFRFIDEYRNITPAGTGNHFHLSWGIGTESLPQLNLSIKLAQQGKISPIKIV